MHERVVFAGEGGQGLMFIGKLFARLMMNHVPHLTLIPSYGAEVRGGTSNCQVVLSSIEIASPIIEEADTLVVMNQPSLDRFLPQLGPDGVAFVDSSRVEDPGDERAILVPATELARQAGHLLAANMVLFGAMMGRTRPADRDEAVQHIRAASAARGAEVETVNVAAFLAGWNAGQA